eukprot:7691332-Lingulodinium_polyedra.AAC.1
MSDAMRCDGVMCFPFSPLADSTPMSHSNGTHNRMPRHDILISIQYVSAAGGMNATCGAADVAALVFWPFFGGMMFLPVSCTQSFCGSTSPATATFLVSASPPTAA